LSSHVLVVTPTLPPPHTPTHPARAPQLLVPFSPPPSLPPARPHRNRRCFRLLFFRSFEFNQAIAGHGAHGSGGEQGGACRSKISRNKGLYLKTPPHCAHKTRWRFQCSPVLLASPERWTSVAAGSRHFRAKKPPPKLRSTPQQAAWPCHFYSCQLCRAHQLSLSSVSSKRTCIRLGSSAFPFPAPS
jgi:hypothetical protein